MGMPIYILGDEVLCPGSLDYDFVDAIKGLSLKDQRKLLTLTRWIASGEFNVAQVMTWTDEQRKTFVQSLPETFVGIEEGI